MTTLTSNLILQKTRLDNLNHVRKLNAAGVQVEDVSVLASVPNLEVCSLSANCIFDLTPFVDCPQLKELYLRKNQVSELHQVLYLTGAPCLQLLRLAENPVADHPDYRAYTIAALSNLVQLDNDAITPEERHAAEQAFPDILDDIRSLPSKTADAKTEGRNRSPSLAGGAAAAPPLSGRSSTSWEREPQSARLPPKQGGGGFTAAPLEPSGSNGYNGDDVPIGGGGGAVRGGAGLRRAQSDVSAAKVAPLNRKSQKPFAAAPRELPALEAANNSVQTAKDVAMVSAVNSLLNEMSPEGLVAVRDHLSKLGL